jgi:hypothetical protein
LKLREGVLSSNLRVAESVRNALASRSRFKMGCFETKSRLLVVAARGLLIVTAIALLVLLAFEPGKGGRQLLGREPEGGVYVGAVNKPADKALF